MRFWSAVLTIETDHGRHWFKVTNPGQAFEARLTQLLMRLVPERVVPLVAVDPDRGWLLTADQGPTLRDAGESDIALWERLAREVSTLQRALVPHEAEVLAAGVEVLSSGDAPAYVLGVLDELEALPREHPQAVSPEQVDRVRAMVPQLIADVDVLDGTGLPNTLQHNDLGDANAFTATDGRVRVFDLGDSYWSHPLPVMQVPIAIATGVWPPPGVEDERVRRLLLAHLSEWSDRPESLLGAWPAATRLARVHRYASWARLAAQVPDDAVGDLKLIDWLDPATG